MLNNLLFITNLFNGSQDTIMWIAILLIVILLIYLFFKFPVLKYLIAFIACALFIGSSLFTASASYEYFTIRGGVWGTLENVLNKNEVVQDNLTFHFTNFNLLETLNPDEYTAKFSIKNVDITLNDKVIYINNTPTELVQRGSTYIFANYTYAFYDEDIKEICNDTLSIKFVFNSAEKENPETGKLEKIDTSVCILTSYGGLQKAKYWNRFLQKNGFKVEINAEEFKIDETINIEQLPERFIYYYDLQGNLIEEYTEKINLSAYPNLTLREPVSSKGTAYPFWRSNDFEIISEDDLSYYCTTYKDLHFYLFTYEYAVVNIKVSQELMNEYENFKELYRNQYEISELQRYYTNYNFGRFWFKFKFSEGVEKNASVIVMQGTPSKYYIPENMSFPGPTTTEVLESCEFITDWIELNHSCYPNLIYSIDNKTVVYSGAIFPMFEIKLYNSDEDLNNIEWGAQSGYIFEEL